MRRSKRLLLRKGSTRDRQQIFADNKGIEYDYKWVAKMSSLYNIVMGCFKNGFPVVVPFLFYNAWAFYPFFFIRKNIRAKEPITVLNHERIHVRQQRDIHLTFSLPLLLVCLISELNGWFNPLYTIILIPFIPTILYGIDMVRSWRNLLVRNAMSEVNPEFVRTPITFETVRANTCFEREAIVHGSNANYLYVRKFWKVLSYTGIKFKK